MLYHTNLPGHTTLVSVCCQMWECCLFPPPHGRWSSLCLNSSAHAFSGQSRQQSLLACGAGPANIPPLFSPQVPGQHVNTKGSACSLQMSIRPGPAWCWPCFVISTFKWNDHYPHFLLLKNWQISVVAVSHTERTLNSATSSSIFSFWQVSTHLHRIWEGKDFLSKICQRTIRKTWQREVGCITARSALCWCWFAAVH